MFDVHVTMASNPGNFVVNQTFFKMFLAFSCVIISFNLSKCFQIQPYLSNRDLLVLMDRLQFVYTKRPYPLVMLEDFVEGGIFAGLHSDGHWYR